MRLLSTQNQLDAYGRIKVGVFLKFDVVDSTSPIEDLQRNLCSLLIDSRELHDSLNSLYYLSPHNCLLRQPWREQQDVDPDITRRESFLDPADEVSIQSIKDDDLYIRNVSGCSSWQRQVVASVSRRALCSHSVAIARRSRSTTVIIIISVSAIATR